MSNRRQHAPRPLLTLAEAIDESRYWGDYECHLCGGCRSTPCWSCPDDHYGLELLPDPEPGLTVTLADVLSSAS